MAPSNQNMDKKNFVSPLGPGGGLGASQHRDPLPNSHPHALSPRSYEKFKKKNTLSHVTISKYRQAVGDWRVPLHPHGLKFTSLSTHQDHLKPGTPE
jgi:hypothetical protein